MRVLLRLVLVVVAVVAVGFLFLGYWAGRTGTAHPSSAPIGTSGTGNTERARERAAELGEKAAGAAARVQEGVSEAGVTAKIKAKMALDDMVKARSIDVTTRGTTVTLSGIVGSKAEHDRAMALARETDGVTDVVDNMRMLQRVG